jgi:polyamine oxidase
MHHHFLLLAALTLAHAVPTTPKNIIVIGAGMSGLAASAQLLKAGYNVTILEARDRIGGRINTVAFNSNRVFDYGASFIHGVEGGNPLVPLADAAQSQRYVPEIPVLALPKFKDHPFTIYEGENVMKAGMVVEGAFGELAEYAATNFDKISPTESLKAKAISVMTAKIQEAAKNPELGIADLDKTVDPAAVAELRANINGANLAALSLKHFGIEKLFEGDEPVLLDGYVRVLKQAAGKALDHVVLKQVVKNVRSTAKGVQVTTEGGQSYAADAVLVTVPLGVLKANTIRFEPDLSAAKKKAIQDHGMGLLNKVLIKFTNLDWFPEADMFMMPPQLNPAVPALNTQSTYINVWNLNRAYKLPYLCFFTYGPFADEIEKMTDKQVGDKLVQLLRARHPKTPNSFTVTHVTRWRADPFARGSYSYPSIASNGIQTIQALGQPSADNRVFWAGEHTEPNYFATVHGAYMTGQRAAQDILNKVL